MASPPVAMETVAPPLMQVNNNTAAIFSSSRSVAMAAMTTNQTLGQASSSSSSSRGPVYVTPRDWGYMSLENVRPVFTDESAELNQYVVLLYGCVMPLLAVLTLCVNCLTCVVLTHPTMRGATGCLLVAIALAEMSMAVWPLPPFLYFFTLGHHREWLPHSWCYATLWMLEYLPTIFHATSVWLTVALAGQRYLAVCRPFQTQRWCVSSSPGAVQCAVVIFILAVGSQLSRIFESHFAARRLPSRLHAGTTVVGCASEFAPFVSAFSDIYFKVYYCFKTLALHVVPCLLVMGLTVGVVVAKIRARYFRRKTLLPTYRWRLKAYWVRMAEVKYSTPLVLTLLLLFLLVETPLAAFYAIELLQNRMVFEFSIVSSETLTSMILFANMSTVVSSPLKIFIFCGLCTTFRTNLVAMWQTCKSVCKCKDDDDDEDS